MSVITTPPSTCRQKGAGEQVRAHFCPYLWLLPRSKQPRKINQAIPSRVSDACNLAPSSPTDILRISPETAVQAGESSRVFDPTFLRRHSSPQAQPRLTERGAHGGYPMAAAASSVKLQERHCERADSKREPGGLAGLGCRAVSSGGSAAITLMSSAGPSSICTSASLAE